MSRPVESAIFAKSSVSCRCSSSESAVKAASCRNLAQTCPDADDILVRTVREALKAFPEIPLFEIPGPLTVELTYYRTDMCDEAFARAAPGTVRADARTLRRTLERLERYEDLRF